MIGSKIIVIGPTGAGKSTFTRKLQIQYKLPVLHMDEIIWNPGWNYVGDEVVVRKFIDFSTNKIWIIEGYIPDSERNNLFSTADSIIYLRYSKFVTMFRFVKRVIKHRKHPRPELPESPDKIDKHFFKLLFGVSENVHLDKSVKQFLGKVIILDTPDAAETFLKTLA